MSDRPVLKLRHPEPEVQSRQDAAIEDQATQNAAPVLLRHADAKSLLRHDVAPVVSGQTVAKPLQLAAVVSPQNAAQLPEPDIRREPGKWVIYRRTARGFARGDSRGARMPRFRHDTYAAAEGEAVRLSQLHPGDLFIVLQEVATVTTGAVPQ